MCYLSPRTFCYPSPKSKHPPPKTRGGSKKAALLRKNIGRRALVWLLTARAAASGVRRDPERFHLSIEARPLVAHPDHESGQIEDSVRARQQHRRQEQEYDRARNRPSQRP